MVCKGFRLINVPEHLLHLLPFRLANAHLTAVGQGEQMPVNAYAQRLLANIAIDVESEIDRLIFSLPNQSGYTATNILSEKPGHICLLQ